jgi:hypothetical protein
MRWLLVRVGGMVMLLVILLIFVRLIGGVYQSSITAIFDDGAKLPQACWHGICPGQHDLSEAQNILRSNGTVATNIKIEGGSVLCWDEVKNRAWRSCATLAFFHGASDKVNSIYLFSLQSSGFRLADAILLLGQPISIYMCTFVPPGVHAGLLFKNGIVLLVNDNQDPNALRLRPEMKIGAVHYWVNVRKPGGVWPWRGFSLIKQKVPGCP